MDALSQLQQKYPALNFQKDKHGRIGFVHEGCFITDPTVTDCGRFSVIPPDHYGVSWLSTMILITHNRAIEQVLGDKIWEN